MAKLSITAIILAVSMSAALADDLPNPRITPGMADPGLTKDVLCACALDFRPKDLPTASKKAIYKAYGMEHDGPPCPAKSII